MKTFKPITISLSPNTEKDDISLAFKLLFLPWLWKKGRAVGELELKLKEYIGTKYAFSFNSGRSSLLTLLRALDFEKGSEVILQAFTCNAAANPIIWSGLIPVYADCDSNTFNIDFNGLEKKITPRTKALIVQHTFGLPADMDKAVSFCQKNNLILIEDCAHSLGATFSGGKVGTFGKASYFSFSRDKIISSVYGGMLVTDDSVLASKIEKIQNEMDLPKFCWIQQQLLHPVLTNRLILPIYRNIGKYLLVLLQSIGVLSKAVVSSEKVGKKPGYFPKRMPNALAILALNQFKKIDRFATHRELIAQKYRRALENTKFGLALDLPQTYLRFTVKHQKAHEIIRYFWDRNILIGDWYTTPLAPKDTRLDKFYYKGDCPRAEELSKVTFNLPTHINISETDADKIIGLLEPWK